jgi:hypothetical protein
MFALNQNQALIASAIQTAKPDAMLLFQDFTEDGRVSGKTYGYCCAIVSLYALKEMNITIFVPQDPTQVVQWLMEIGRILTGFNPVQNGSNITIGSGCRVRITKFFQNYPPPDLTIVDFFPLSESSSTMFGIVRFMKEIALKHNRKGRVVYFARNRSAFVDKLRCELPQIQRIWTAEMHAAIEVMQDLDIPKDVANYVCHLLAL